MAHLTLYRKWRPQTFAKVIGQEHITRTLSNAIKQNLLSHAYLFCGPRGTGKTTVARILAKAINCEKGPDIEPCNKCQTCREITLGTSMEVHEIDAASNRGIDNIRELRENARFLTGTGRTRVYIIDEVHMLTEQASNALLKLLEEPPEHVIFILATTEPHKVISTIQSRCQRFDFRNISLPEIVKSLAKICQQEKIKIEKLALRTIASHANGSLRDALAILEQLVSFCQPKPACQQREISYEETIKLLGLTPTELLVEFMEILIARDAEKLFNFINDLVERGYEIKRFNHDLLKYLRHLLVFKQTKSAERLVDMPVEFSQKLSDQAARINLRDFSHFISLFTEVNNEIRHGVDARLSFELAALKATQIIEAPAQVKVLDIIDERGSKKELESQAITKKIKEPPTKAIASKDTSRESVGKVKSKVEAREVAIDFKKIVQIWPIVLQKVKEEKIPTYALLKEGVPASIKGDLMVINFSKKHAFHKERLETNDGLKIVEKVLEKILGVKLKIICELGEEKLKEPQVGNKVEKEKQELLNRNTVVKLVEDIFDAKIIDERTIKEE
jgi:DNA polymerase-3 subunit gamma/tau